MAGLAVVHVARDADEGRLFGRAVDDEPGVDGNAMAADAGAGLKDVNARVAVGDADGLSNGLMP